MARLTSAEISAVVNAGGSVMLPNGAHIVTAAQVPTQAALDAGTYDAYSDQANQASLLAARLARPGTRIGRMMAATGSGAMAAAHEGASATVTGTSSARGLSATNPWPFEDYTSAATLNAQASITNGNSCRWSQKPLFQARCMLGTSLALLRAYVGWATTWATLLGTDTPGTATLSGAAFRFSTAAGDANWQAVTFNGASQTVVDTGVPPVVAVSQKFEISDDGSNTVFRINGVTVATIATTRPAATVTPRKGAGLQTLEAVAKTIDVAWMFDEQDG